MQTTLFVAIDTKKNWVKMLGEFGRQVLRKLPVVLILVPPTNSLESSHLPSLLSFCPTISLIKIFILTFQHSMCLKKLIFNLY